VYKFKHNILIPACIGGQKCSDAIFIKHPTWGFNIICTFADMKDVSNNNGEMMRRGRIEVICGSMFSGKTEELIRRMKRAMFARQKVEIFKPAMDTRYSDEDVVSHEGNSIPSTPIDSSASILLMAQGNDVIGIDEAQFFDEHIVEVCNQLANQGIRVIVAGLDLDFKGEPFGPMPQLLAIADEVSKVHAICVRCGALAYVSHRLVNVEKQVLLGEKMEYEPLCRDCYRKALEEAHNEENT
jgi:thymidine kinase